ncbi:hypothetical protein ACQP2T_31310 [Nonomuraea sp. CA-143628]|uniref:hypothetical protein n=1 Tax=Nonomuraea sp. CA-143628 TaxID=3239997 RepID=UPI003D936E0E
MHWLGFVPDEVTSAPPVAVARPAERLGVDPAVVDAELLKAVRDLLPDPAAQ